MSTSSATSIPKPVRARLAASARARVAQLSDPQLAALKGDVVEELADQLAHHAQVPYAPAARAFRKAVRQAQWARLSGTPPNVSLALDWSQQRYVNRKAQAYGSRAAVLKAALALLMQSDP